jgi:hypothetical protein
MRRRAIAVLLVTVAFGAPRAFAQAVSSTSVASCQKAVAAESATYVRSVTQMVDRCLDKMSGLVVQKGSTTTVAATTAALSCVRGFARLASTGDERELGARFTARVARKCAASGAPLLGAANLGEYCKAFGGDGAVDDFAEWLTCLHATADVQVQEAIATRWPRALEWFAALANAIAALPPAAATSNAHAALVALDAAIEGPIDDDRPDAAAHTGLVATGARECVLEQGGSLGACDRGPSDQDGMAQAGLAARYTDNGDGTITDGVTGLTWEKLGDDGSIHHRFGAYTIADAVGVKIAYLNAGDGFAGHTDWRLPNRRELESLIDSGNVDPAIRSAFHDGCAPSCSADACSCTLPEPYWTSTAYQADPSQSWVVDFYQGEIVELAGTSTARVRAVRGGARDAAAPSSALAAGKASADLAACQKAVAGETARYVRASADTVGKCLERMSAEMLGKDATPPAAAHRASNACVTALRKLVNTAEPAKQLRSKLDVRVAAKCDPSVNPKLDHQAADTWTIGDRTLSAANLGAYCAQHGGDGSIGSFAEWQDCVRAAADAVARAAIATRWPRALESFAALQAELASAPPSAKTDDALAALASLDDEIEGATDDDLPEPPPAPPARLLATGQTQCVQADATMGPCPGARPGQDGDLQLGVARRYTDNGDGTITDHVTGLMWEKLSDDDSIHDYNHSYAQQGAHYNKLGRLNRYAYAGYSDWRLPNRRELESLIDAGRFSPAIDPIFHQGCTPGCSVLDCSCTSSTGYRSSTYAPFADRMGSGVQVYFGDGAVHVVLDAAPRDQVRVVRAGNAPAKVVVNRSPEAFDVDVKFPWKRDTCVTVGLLGVDSDSPYTWAELVTQPAYGFITEFTSAQIPYVPDTGSAWGPYDYWVPAMSNLAAQLPDGRWVNEGNLCYVPFSTTFTGTDSFTFVVRDDEGNTSNVARATILIFSN